MPAYARTTTRRHLIIRWSRFGEETIRIHCNSGIDAMEQAVILLVRAGLLVEGDCLTVGHGDEELPEASRASHSSS